MAEKQKAKAVTQLSEDQIAQCIATLEILNADTNQIFDIPKDKRLALIMAAALCF